MNESPERLLIRQLIQEECHLLIPINLNYAMKDSNESKHWRKEGNDLFSKNVFDQEKVLSLYSKSIAMAELNSEDLALAYSNRSALFYRIKRFDDSILDIDRALGIDQFRCPHQIKCLTRKILCLTSIDVCDNSEFQRSLIIKKCQEICCQIYRLSLSLSDQPDQIVQTAIAQHNRAMKALSDYEKSEHIKDQDSPKHLIDFSEQVENENNNTLTEIQYNKSYGNHLVAKQDVLPGEVLFIKRPYVSCLNDIYCHLFCHFCFKKTYASIPCDSCYWTFYCSEKCKQAAWDSYHNYECVVFSYISNEKDITHFDKLSMKCMLKGLKDAGSMDSFKKDVLSCDELIGSREYGFYLENSRESNVLNPEETNKFKSVYGLYNKMSRERLRNLAAGSAIILIVLSKYTSFFGNSYQFKNTKDLLDNDDVLFIGEVLLKLKKRSFKSTYFTHTENILCKFKNDPATCKVLNCCYNVATVSQKISLMSHSCYPNVRICMAEKNKLIVFAIRPIQKDSQLFISNMRPFYEIERPFRQTLIRSRYNFMCECVACKNNWATLFMLYKMPVDEPREYIKVYEKKESDLFHENNWLVKPILISKKSMCDKTTVKQLRNAMVEAINSVKQPSVVICELMICLAIAVEDIYGCFH